MKATTMQKRERISDVKELKNELSAQVKDNNGIHRIIICGGSGCASLGGQLVRERFEKEIKNNGFNGKIELKKTGCPGICVNGPIVTIEPGNTFYQRINEDDVPKIIEKIFGKMDDDTIKSDRVVDHLLYTDPDTGNKITSRDKITFFNRQERVAFRNCGKVDPTDINEYILGDGYLALEKALKDMTPENVVQTVIDSGLRGRGGGGFSTGKKWNYASETENSIKYIICNGGAYKDRTILEGDPHSVIEGMVIAAYAIGACRGYFYVRAEDTLTIQHLQKAIADAESLGLLGENILNKGLDFHLEIIESAGAFVCGEETALISFIEDSRGMPDQKPPYPAISGLNGKPTIVNNVETLANIAPLILDGAKRFSKLGTDKSTGTKLYVLEGNTNNTGLVEVPFGSSLRDLISIGGGIAKGRDFKTALIGGPSGGFVPKGFLDVPLEFDTIKAAGAIVGSSSINVMDDSACIIEVTRLSIAFLADESCGKCVPCRIGTKRMLEILTRITGGKAKIEDIDLLQELAGSIKDTALCGLGQTSANPVLTGIKHFRNEYEAHIRDKHCHAAVCETLAKSPCQNSCPAGINVPEYVALIGKKKYVRSLDLIRKRNPFSSVCGHICNHPCESLCRRGELEESIAIKDVKRFASDFDPVRRKKYNGKKGAKTGKKVAVIGSGPGGLT
ncbi:MAG: NADH-ubiquinone oxidoreductase-F iron-sulfur binding region domain-containing protein, partial [Candidatus Anammoxibacter sp.]